MFSRSFDLIFQHTQSNSQTGHKPGRRGGPQLAEQSRRQAEMWWMSLFIITQLFNSPDVTERGKNDSLMSLRKGHNIQHKAKEFE